MYFELIAELASLEGAQNKPDIKCIQIELLTGIKISCAISLTGNVKDNYPSAIVAVLEKSE